MKSLKERLAEKKLREEKESMKLSGKVKCFTVRLPYSGFPYFSSNGDIALAQRKVDGLLNKIWRNCDGIIYEKLKEAIAAEEKRREERDAQRSARWNRPAPVPAPIAPSTVSPNGEPIAVQPTPAPNPAMLEYANRSINPDFFSTITFTGPTSGVDAIYTGEVAMDHIVPVVNLSPEERMLKVRRLEEINAQLSSMTAEITNLSNELGLDERRINQQNENARHLFNEEPATVTISQDAREQIEAALRELSPEVEDAMVQPAINEDDPREER